LRFDLVRTVGQLLSARSFQGVFLRDVLVTKQGRTRDEALANIREAIDLCLEARKEEGWELPEHHEIVCVEVAA
jgi:hypothetical protein